ncbi:MAG TPA: hypothetical protein DCP25_17310 [Chloroflexi bacterium]|nr:hypothetical protein [Chloroflexota bacterium]
MVAAAEEWALFFHLLGAFLFIAGVIVAGVVFEAARRRRRPSEIALLLGLARIGVLLVALGAVIVLVFGLWLVQLGRFGYGAGWVVTALALFVVVILLGGLGGQSPKRARKLAVQLAKEADAESDELRSLLDDPLARTVNYLSAALLVAIVALMVFRPGA